MNATTVVGLSILFVGCAATIRLRALIGLAGPSARITVWLLTALGAALLVLGLTHDAGATGQILGFRLTGSAALFVVIWALGVRWDRQTVTQGKRDRTEGTQQAEIERLLAENLVLSGEAGPIVLTTQVRYEYRIEKARAYRVGIISGDLMLIRDFPIWVNSENTNMQMSRFYEQTVSARIRYYGAERDPITGEVLEDLIADELEQALGGALSVQPGAVIRTSAGKLKESNGVKSILHVAAVQGQPGSGYRAIADPSVCVRAALESACSLPPKQGGDTLVMPLFGTGSGQAAVAPTARILIDTAIQWLESRRPQAVHNVYFLAYRDIELKSCRSHFASLTSVVNVAD